MLSYKALPDAPMMVMKERIGYVDTVENITRLVDCQT